MGTLYAAPPDIWVHACPPVILFGNAGAGAQGIDQGRITAPTRIVGTGTGIVTGTGIPRDFWTVQVRCVFGGQVNDSNTLNPDATALPAFVLSNNAGATWSEPVAVSATRNQAIIEHAPFGIRFGFRNGPSGTSFVVGDIWQTITSPSADIVASIPVVSAGMDKYLSGSFDLPLTSFPADFTYVCCDLQRWHLLKKIGIADRQDLQVYKPIESWEWLRDARAGNFVKPSASLGIVEQAPGTSFPLFVPPLPDPLWPPI